MFRIKNIRNSTVAKQTNININQSLNKPSPLPIKPEIKQRKEIIIEKKNTNLPINTRKPITNIKVETPKLKVPQQKRVILNTKNNRIVAQKLHTHLPIKVIQKTSIPIANKKQNTNQKIQKQLGQKKLIVQNKPHKIQQQKIEEKPKKDQNILVQNLQKIVQEYQIQKQQKEAVQFLLKKQQDHRQRELDQKTKLQQEQRRKKKQADIQSKKIKKQNEEQEQHLKRQLQLKQMTQKINARRKAREQQRQRRANLQRQMQNQMAGVGGIVALSDPLAHIEMSEAIMDKQVQLLINMKFAGYPNKQAIQTQVQQLERINRSYLLVRTDPNNPLNRGLSNFRIQLFNRVGELVMQGQAAQGASPSGLRVFDSDSRNHPQIQGMKITRGLQGHINSLLKTIKLHQTQQCAICLNQIQSGEMIYQVPCEHIFHKKCLQDWLNTNANCPSCRFNIKYNHH